VASTRPPSRGGPKVRLCTSADDSYSGAAPPADQRVA